MCAAAGSESWRRNEAWVTFAETDEDAKNALILLKSLRRVCTNRQIIIIIAPTLAPLFWDPLAQSFDAVYPLPPQKEAQFQRDSCIFALSLVSYDKLVILHPNTIVLDNSDEMFELEGLRMGSKETGALTLVLQPDFKAFLTLVQQLSKNGNTLQKATVAQIFKNSVGQLEEKYDFHVDSTTAKLSQEELLIKNPKIVHWQNVDALISQNGHLAPFFQSVWTLWKELGGEAREFIEFGGNVPIGKSIPWKSYQNEPIAIIGISCRMPSSNNVEEYWKLLLEGECAVRDIPEGRWTKEQSCVLTPEHKKVQAGFLSCSVDEFDSKFFVMSPAEVEFTDPQQRILLEVAWEALEDGGINAQELYGTQVGVFAGAWTLEYKDHLLENGLKEANNQFRGYMGNSYGTMGARLAHYLGVTGPNICPESGCSSSSVAVGLGIQSLRKGEVNMALACGVNLLLMPFKQADFSGLLSEDNRCQVFDIAANGFARAEGCGVLVLKRLSDAVKDGDRIHAVIRGYGMSQEGTSKSLGTPTVDGEAFAMQLALNDAQVLPQEIQVVEAHGTGTMVGDPLEVKAITKVYSTPERKTPLIITAGKANIGHTEAASGIAGIIKTILELKHGVIPPQILIKTLNTRINLEAIPAQLAFTALPWTSSGLKLAGISSFGITGTDTHLILQEAPPFPGPDEKCGVLKSPPQNLFTFSAKSKEALDEMIQQYNDFFQRNKQEALSLDNVAFTANTGRAHFQHRVALWGKDCSDILEKLEKRAYSIGTAAEEKKNITFLFTGQGSQFHGMGKVLYENCPVFKVNFDKCENILKSFYALELKDALWGEDKNKLHQSLYSQSAIFVMEYCLVKVWESWGVHPTSVMGHSLGEFAAATTAGILSLEDALKLLGARCRLIDSLPIGKMVAVKANEQQAVGLVAEFCRVKDETNVWLDTAAINSADQTTLAGPEAVVQEFFKFCEKKNTKCHVLDATHAFHSRAMDPILGEYQRVAKSVTYHAPKIQFISGVDGTAVCNLDASYWLRHTREGVQFSKAVSACFADSGGGATSPLFLEVGPHPVLSALVHANAPATTDSILCYPSVRKPPVGKSSGNVESTEWQTMLDTIGKLHVAGVPIDFKAFHRFHPKRKVQLPFYPFQRRRFWMPCRKYTVSKKQFHPLLGTKTDLPLEPEVQDSETSKQTRFENLITVKSHGYIGDHKVGKYALMPAAGFVEMCLAAVSTVTAQEFPIILDNVVIKSAFLVEEVVPREIHTVLTLSRGENDAMANISIFGKEADAKATKSWTLHSQSSAVLTLSESQISIEQQAVEEFATVKERMFAEEPTNLEIYKEMALQGYNFGKLFQSLGQTWIVGSERLTHVFFSSELNDERDMCHPVLIDSMIQALLLTKMDKLNGLYLPVAVKKFVLLDTSFCQGDELPEFFVHVKDISPTDKTQQIAVLYKSPGTAVAVMYGLEVVKTLLPMLEKGLETAKKEKALPPLFHEEWQRSNVFGGTQIDGQRSLELTSQAITAMTECNSTEETEAAEAYSTAEKAISASIILALFELGLSRPPVESWIDVVVLMEELNIQKSLLQPMRRYLEILCEDGYLVQSLENQNLFQVLRELPSKHDLLAIQESLNTESIKSSKEHPFHVYFKRLSSFLNGEESILDHLFPEDDKGVESVSANKMYSETQISARNNKLIDIFLSHTISQRFQNPDGKQGVLRVLEIGAGTGSSTTAVLQALTKMDTKFSYTFTDISNVFFYKARETFAAYSNSMQYKVLNIEEDPKTQGFAPNQFDIVVAGNVLHATHNLTETCRNIRLLMKNFGVMFIAEIFKPQRIIDITFGLLPGYWRQTDLDLRPKHCVIDGNGWLKVLHRTGFTEASAFIETNAGRCGVVVGEASGHLEQYISPTHVQMELARKMHKSTPNTWLLFGDLVSPFSQELTTLLTLHGKSVMQVEHSSNKSGFTTIGNNFRLRGDSKADLTLLWDSLRQRNLLGDVEGVVFSLTDISSNPKECEEICTFCIQSFLYLLQSVLEEWPSKLPKIIAVTKGVFSIGDQTPTCPAAAAVNGMFRTFLSENRTVVGRYIDLSPDEGVEINASQVISELWVDDLQPLVAFRNGVRHVPKLMPYRLGLPFPPLELDTTFTAKRFHLIIPKTHSIADLKFETHNIKPTLGPFEIEVQVKASALNFRDLLCVIKPTSQFDELNGLGLDICGIVVAVGSSVTKRKVGDAVLGCSYDNVALPSHVVLHENLAVPLPAHMTFAEGATLPTVFVTVYHCLVTVGKLKAGETILIHTASGGVGLCAVQIAQCIGAQIVATAGSRRKRAYLNFVGVQNVFNSRDLSFGENIMSVTDGRGVDIVLNSLTGPGFKETSLKCCALNARFVEMSKLNIWSVEEVMKLRPDVKYSVEDLSSADPTTMFFLFQELEKYLVHPTHPLKPLPYTRFDAVSIRSALKYLEKAKQIGKVVCILPEPPKKEICKMDTPLFNDRSSYLVTGGNGGIGFEVVKWLCSNGARTVVICGRRVPSPENMKQIEALNNSGNNVLVVQGDIGDKERCREILAWIKSELPPLRGIMHSAGCLSDATIPNQSMEKFETTFNPKIRGGWNLHSLTLNYQLEHFVMFSSGVAVIGSSGQSNHSACNSFLDSLAFYRRSMGLVGCTVKWGQWGEVGVAANKNISVFYPFSTQEGLNTLELVIRTDTPQVAPLDFDIAGLRMLFPWVQPMLDLLSHSGESNGGGKWEGISSDSFWGELNSVKEDDLRYTVIKNYLARIVTNLLRLDETLEPNQNFQDLGMDSLMMIELKNQVQSMLGPDVIVSASEMADCKTLSLTTNKVMDLIYSNNSGACQKLRNELISDDSKLWESVDITNAAPPLPIDQVEVVFMTGCTGVLGPYVLQQLTHYPQVKKVVCLVRQGKLNSAKARLLNRLQYLELFEKTDAGKITVVEGDLTKDLFGLEETLYNNLAGEVGAIIHCGVYSSHLDMYGKGASTRYGIKAVNVDGTQRILQFASHILVKHVYNGSTMLGAWYKNESYKNMNAFHSHWPEDGDADDAPSFGYGISKFIGDRLMGLAVKKGIPCKSFRFPKINGAKETGRQEYEGNHFFIKFIYFVQRGVMPDGDIPLQVIPVDICAQVTLSLFFNPAVPSELFNVFNPHHRWESDLGLLTPEYGPLFRITERLWEIADQLTELRQVAEKDNAQLLPTFLQLLNDFCKRENMDLEPIMDIMREIVVQDTTAILDNPALLLKNERIRSFLKEEYGYPLKSVSYNEFVAQLQKDGERVQLYKWVDFYTGDESMYKVMLLSSLSGQYDHYKSDPHGFMGRSCAKILQYIPNYNEIVPDGLDVVRQDFEYAVNNCLETFRKTKVSDTVKY